MVEHVAYVSYSDNRSEQFPVESGYAQISVRHLNALMLSNGMVNVSETDEER